MKFDEHGKGFAKIIVPPQNTFVYFLLNGDEVVYVGQTKNGLTRPFSHKDKVFDSVIIKFCDIEQLDGFEDEYIIKYKPRYNKAINHGMWVALTKIKMEVRQKFGSDKFSVYNLKKIMRENDISVCDFNNSLVANVQDVGRIYELLNTGKYDKYLY